MLFQSENEVYQSLKEGLNKAQDHLDFEYASIRAGRANPKILDRVLVNYYGSMTPLNQMANITVPDPRCLLINVWDLSAFKDVLKAINEANLGLAPSDDGKSIRLTFPVPTEERRRELVKQAKALLEEAKVSMRNERRDAMDALKEMKKENLLTEDTQKNAEKEVQKILDNATKDVDDLFAAKEKEIMSV
ncbi:MAG: ribosome recycling factor [Clostridia bacterium]|nr:ribosome recycling factor [Clostridia bacterium]